MKKIISIALLLSLFILLVSCGSLEVIRTKLSYDEELIELNLGDEISVIPNCNKENAKIVYKASSDIVSIDENGNLKALKTGTVIIEASVNKRDSISAKLIVVISENNTYTIYYDVNGGDPLENNQITYGKEDAITLPTPTKKGYKFLGWHENNSLVTNLTKENHTLTAMWEKLSTYTIYYDVNGGSMNTNSEYEFMEDENITLPKPVKTGCIFLGWYEGLEEVTKIENRNYSLVARWYEIASDSSYYTITYNTNGGTLPTNTLTSFIDSKEVDLPVPTKKGYKFIGWYENNSLVTTITNKNYSLIAVWEELPIYSISYDLDGGTLSTLINAYTKDDVIIIDEPTKEGYTFIGWTSELNTKPVKNLEIKNQEKNLNLKANYQANTYQITFKSNNKDVKVDVKYNETIKIEKYNFTNNGMKLIGWNTEADFTGNTYLVDEELTYTFTEDIVLYAEWTSLINLALNSSEKLTNDIPIITKGQKEFTLPVPETKEFVFFDGWYLGEQKITNELGKNLNPWEFDSEVTLVPKWVDSITKNGIKYYYLGEYPQTKVTDKATIEVLNKKIPNHLGYCELDGDYYAKVTFDKNTTVYFNDGTKVLKGETYYFKVEKVLWRVINEKNNIVISEYVLDAISFYDSNIERKKYNTILDLYTRIYPNDFSESKSS